MTAELNGLVLAGGLSSRMGEEKGLIRYHGFPQYLYAMQLLRQFCGRVYLVCREDQQHLFSGVNIITDNPLYSGHGPISGLLSAFEHKNGPWMVLACDYPYMESSDLRHLAKFRDPQQIATVFKDEETGFLEPLTGIYEEKALVPLKKWFEKENYSLRKFLEQHDISSILPVGKTALISVDNNDEKKQAISYFRHGMV